jgi:heme a synthase
MRGKYAVSPQTYQRVALGGCVLLTLIVATGAAVRLTGSGLGCPDWPKCYGQVVAPLQLHAVIEYANRLVSGVVGVGAVCVAVLAWLRRPFRRDLALLSLALPLGVVAQAVLGGLTVRNELAPLFVMAHFGLSMLVLVASVVLVWRSRPHARRVSDVGRGVRWSVRGLAVLGFITIVAGTVATGAGPHAGAAGTGEHVVRLNFAGATTLELATRQHALLAALLGLACALIWLYLRLRTPGRGMELLRTLTVVLVLLACQGLIGLLQLDMGLPSEVVWVHVTLATVIWVTLVWAAAVAQRPGLAAELELAAERVAPMEPINH